MARLCSSRVVAILAFLLSVCVAQSANATSGQAYIGRAIFVSDLPDAVASRIWEEVHYPVEGVVRAYGIPEFSLQGKAFYTTMSLLLSRCATDPQQPPPTTFEDRCITKNSIVNDVPYGVAIILEHATPIWTFEVRIYPLESTGEPLVFSTMVDADAEPELTVGLKTILSYATVEIARMEQKPKSPARLPPERGILLVVDPRSAVKEGTVVVDGRYEKQLDVEHPLLLPGVSSATIRRKNPDNSVLETDISTGIRPVVVVRTVRPLPRAPVSASTADPVINANGSSGKNWWTRLTLVQRAGSVIGTMGVLTGGVTLYLYRSGVADQERSQSRNVSYKKAADLYQSGKDQQGIAVATGISAGGLVAVGAALFFWDPLFGPKGTNGSRGDPPAGIVPTDDGATFYVFGHF